VEKIVPDKTGTLYFLTRIRQRHAAAERRLHRELGSIDVTLFQQQVMQDRRFEPTRNHPYKPLRDLSGNIRARFIRTIFHLERCRAIKPRLITDLYLAELAEKQYRMKLATLDPAFPSGLWSLFVRDSPRLRGQYEPIALG